MEVVGTLFASLVGSGGAAAGATAAGTAAAGAGAAGAGLSTLTLLQGAGTVFSAIASIGAGNAAKAEAEAQAKEVQFQARNEFIEGQEKSAALRAELSRTVANQTVAFASSGVDLGSVSVETARSQAVTDAERELSATARTAGANSLARQRQARNLRIQGRNAATQGYIGAAAGVLDTSIDIARRGETAKVGR